MDSCFLLIIKFYIQHMSSASILTMQIYSVLTFCGDLHKTVRNTQLQCNNEVWQIKLSWMDKLSYLIQQHMNCPIYNGVSHILVPASMICAPLITDWLNFIGLRWPQTAHPWQHNMWFKWRPPFSVRTDHSVHVHCVCSHTNHTCILYTMHIYILYTYYTHCT